MIPLFKVAMSPNAADKVRETLESGMVGEGPRVKEFQYALRERFKIHNIIPLNSGTSALTMALRLAGVEGGEVITTPFTMIATNVAIKAERGIPVFADIEKDSVNISFEDVQKKITKNTKAIVVTLVGGIPVEMEKFMTLGIPVIVDAAHAVDTHYKDKHISYWGDYVCFSFQSIKQLNTGDGGALVCKDARDYQRAKKLKWFGMSRDVPEGMTRLEHQMTADVEEWGYKMHMNDISASIGLANIELLDDITAKQRDNAKFYNTFLNSGIKVPKESNPSWWAYPILVDNRDEFIKKMADKGIECSPMWRRNDEYTVFQERMDMGYAYDNLPNMTAIQDKIVFIPVGWWVTPEDTGNIVKAICE